MQSNTYFFKFTNLFGKTARPCRLQGNRADKERSFQLHKILDSVLFIRYFNKSLLRLCNHFFFFIKTFLKFFQFFFIFQP
jgi:hypothetical protein